MQSFINYVIDVVRILNNAISSHFELYLQSWAPQYQTFLSKNVFLDSSLIGLNMTYAELFKFVFIWVLALTIIILFIKFICKIFTIFRV